MRYPQNFLLQADLSLPRSFVGDIASHVRSLTSNLMVWRLRCAITRRTEEGILLSISGASFANVSVTKMDHFVLSGAAITWLQESKTLSTRSQRLTHQYDMKCNISPCLGAKCRVVDTSSADELRIESLRAFPTPFEVLTAAYA